jgi:hypothetical protein
MRIQQGLTSKAKEVVDSLKRRKIQCLDIVAVEVMDHDGYDSQGPKSDLWDLYVVLVRESDETSVVQHYHRENWYLRGGDYHPYELVSKDVSLNTFFTEQNKSSPASLLFDRLRRGNRDNRDICDDRDNHPLANVLRKKIGAVRA